jgi:EAL domain-containing protein (putative c-di-GMP-specific phosphodiesterase class I)
MALLSDLEAALGASNIAPDRVVIEIAEGTAMQRTDHVLTALRAIKRLGVRIAIDDFGTGYSSLNYLRQFPIDILKIDKSFVTGLGMGDGDSGLARSVVALGEALDLRLIAEGVEYPAQRRELRALGCDFAQGFLVAPALPATQLVAWASAQAAHRTGNAAYRYGVTPSSAHHMIR